MHSRLDRQTLDFAMSVLARHKDTTSPLCPSCGYRPQVTRGGHCAGCAPARTLVTVAA